MEETSSPKSDRKVFEIPIKYYEEDMDTELAKGKKKEILELFTKYNQIRTQKEYDDISINLHRACQEGDVDLIRILLSEQIEYKSLVFKIDKTNKTASLIKNTLTSNVLIVPRLITHEKNDYLVTSICSFHITNRSFSNIPKLKVKFEENSAVKTIYGNSFLYSDICEIYFPESLTELKKGWCNFSRNLTNIEISPSNDRLIFKDEKYLLGKTNSNSDEFDVLFFVRRDLKEVSIPQNVKIIESYSFQMSNTEKVYLPDNLIELKENSFDNMHNLTKIIISPTNNKFIFKDDKYLLGKTNSNDDEFDILIFASRDIKEISIPPNITKICESAFFNCSKLTKVSFSENSKLQTIEKYAFYNSGINEINIPSNVTKICNGAFFSCENLTKVSIPENSKLKIIGRDAFYDTGIKEIFIPDCLIKLEEGWFYGAHHLTKIIISPTNNKFIFKDDKYLLGKTNSNDDEFDILLFANRNIREISIPPNITKICEHAFYSCENLTKVSIPKNSKLQTIEKYAFSQTRINEIFIPPSVTKICERAFSNCENLTRVSIPENSNLQTIENSAFLQSDIRRISIPPSVTKICEFAFSNCSKLKKVLIPENSKLQTIEMYAFSQSGISEIFISSNVTKICEDTFSSCKNLTKVSIPENSNLQTIERNAFYNTGINEISIPDSLIKLEEGWFYGALNLTRIIVSPTNNKFIFKDGKYLLGKTNSNDDEFDILLFASRNIKEISIPPSVTKICEHIFYSFDKLTRVSIPENSKLQTIEKSAFSRSGIFEIYLPPSVTKICENAFSSCKNLTTVSIPENSKLQTIERNAFYDTGIYEIFIPPNVTKIYEDTFSSCRNLTKVSIPENSNLQTIERDAFSQSGIKEISIPNSLIKLEEGWFYGAYYLTKIIISPTNNKFIFKDDKYLLGKTNSNDDEFDILIFASRNIKEISIPPSVTKICENAFSYCINLTKASIPIDSKLQAIENYAFYNTCIKEIYLPPTVTKVCEHTFSYCPRLTKVSIPKNSNLQIIERDAFSQSGINEIYIPPTVTKICDHAFSYCSKLTKVSIPENSNLQTIGNRAFYNSGISEFYISPSITKICEFAFGSCSNFKIIEISEESKLQSFPISAFYNPDLIIMIPVSLEKLIQVI